MLRLVVALVLASMPAAASVSFPSAARTHLDTATAISCTQCHQTAAGGFGTIDKEFGLALMERGLVARVATSVGPALDQLEADNVDSDGDGTGDVDELRAGTDPNIDDETGPDVAPLEYGFGCGSSARAPSTGLASLLVLAQVLRWSQSRRTRCTGRLTIVRRRAPLR